MLNLLSTPTSALSSKPQKEPFFEHEEQFLAQFLTLTGNYKVGLLKLKEQ